MNLASELQYTLASLIGFMLESICYGKYCPTTAFSSDTDLYVRFIGIYCMIFGAFVRCQLKRTNNASKTLLYLVTANFIVSTAYLAVDVTASQVPANISMGVITASNTLYACIDFISQIILVNFLHRIPSPPLMRVPFPFTKLYRCWIIWRQLWVMVVPILLTLAFLGTNLPNLN